VRRPNLLLAVAPLALALAAAPSACSSSAKSASPSAPPPAAPWNADGSPQTTTYEGYQIVWLKGTPYEMGQQHGKLMHDILIDGVAALANDPLLHLMSELAVDQGLVPLAQADSYPDFVQECQGLVSATTDIGFTMADCLVLNFGDVLAEYLESSTPVPSANLQPGCTQVIATGGATTDGRLLHARLMDWNEVDYIVAHPTIFVRQPTGGVAHVTIGFPGNISPYQGMNASGLTVSTNRIYANAEPAPAGGRSGVQLAGEILAHAHSLDEARTMVQTTPELAHLIMGISDANAGTGEIYEIGPTAVGVRPLDESVVYATNHYVGATMAGTDTQPPPAHTTLRYQRLGDLVPKEGKASLYGALDPTTFIGGVLRDRVNPQTMVTSPPVFDDGQSLATDGALYAAVFDAGHSQFWVAAGAIPIPSQAFVGFSLAHLLGNATAAPETLKIP
jgi:hypothetical protein